MAELTGSALVAQLVTRLMHTDDLNERAGASKILKTIFSNIVNNPDELKYRKVKMGVGLSKLTSLDGGKQVAYSLSFFQEFSVSSRF